jgi:sterol desaturase/sphingolipid hydroxylase (fatty acid hydroxylase superfamily)
MLLQLRIGRSGDEEFADHGCRGRRGVPMLPWLASLGSVQWLLLAWPWAACGTLEITLIVFAHGYLHAQFHVLRTPLEGLAWFRRARSIHSRHHDRDVNFMVVDHFWDRVCGTFQGPD